MKYRGKKCSQVSNPCLTASEAIELANSIDFIKRISEAKSGDIAVVTKENIRLQQEVINLQAVIDKANDTLYSVLEGITDHQFNSLDLEKLMVVAIQDGVDYKIPLIELVENALIKIYKNNLED